MDDNTFDMVLQQLSDLKHDIQQAKDDIMTSLKTRDEYWNGFRVDVNKHIDDHCDELEKLKRANWMTLGAAGVLMTMLEIGFRAFDYWLLKK